MALHARGPRAAGRPSVPGHVQRAPLALHRPRRQPLLGRRRHPGRPFHLLRGRGVRRHLQDDRRRRALAGRSSTATRSSRSAPSPSSVSDPNIVWAGTGEGKIRSHISLGQGIYKSTDAGKSWTLMGLEQTGRIPRLVIDPKNPDVVLACALGHAYGPQPERGVFRTTDGGRTWAKTLFVDENTGCSDIAMDPNNPAHPVRGHVAARDPHVGPHERRAGQRPVHVARRRRHVEEAHRPRPARQAGRQGRRRHLPLEPQPRLRADRNRRRHPLGRQGDGRGPGVPQRRRRRDMAGRELRPPRHGPAALLLAHGRRARRRGRGVLLDRLLRENAGRRLDAHAADARPGPRRRPPRHLDRSDERRSHDRRARPGPVDLDQPGAHVVQAAPHERADVPRDRRQRDPVQRPGQQAGRADVPRSEQQPAGERHHSARDVARGRRRRERVRHARPDRSQHRLVERLRLRHGRRHRRPLRGDATAVPERRGVARPVERPGRGAEVPLRMGRAAAHLAARPQHRLHRQPARAPDDERRPVVGGRSAPT